MLRSSIMSGNVVTPGHGPRARRSAERGFSLTELMATVAITGILATLALAAFHDRAFRSNVANAKIVVKSIAVAEEHYRAENQVYLDVSALGVSGWYPHATVARGTKVSFWKSPPDGGGDAETTKWQALAPDVRQMVEFSFKVNAGLPTVDGAVPSGILAADSGITLPPNVAVEPWYLVQARADADADGTFCTIAAASWAPEVVVSNDGE